MKTLHYYRLLFNAQLLWKTLPSFPLHLYVLSVTVIMLLVYYSSYTITINHS